MCTMCKGMCMVSMHVHAQVSCSLYADISKHRVWSIVSVSVFSLHVPVSVVIHLHINNAFTSSL